MCVGLQAGAFAVRTEQTLSESGGLTTDSAATATGLGLLGKSLNGIRSATSLTDDAARSAVPQVLKNKQAGDAAADSIASRYAGAQREVTLQAASGPRRLDVLTPQGLAIESKVGRVSYTSSVRQQIQRDVELMNDPTSGVRAVEWHFRTSAVTGLGGPTGPLRAALNVAGIGIR